MKVAVPAAQIPGTIKDAIEVCGRLGCRYLWVDALCIIQDCDADWEVEASKMASVYKDAYLTIAATAAASVTEGFLANSYQHEIRLVFSVAWVNKEGVNTTLKARIRPTHDWTMMHYPLDSRAWSFQEALLSTRVVYFTPEEIRWQCISRSTCECRQSVLSNDLDLNNIWNITNAVDAARLWRQAVVRYSGRELTFIRDKLPAIAGLAMRFHKAIQSGYVAGLWKSTLVSDLTWCCRDCTATSRSAQRPYEYVGPTFSWVSVPSEVYFTADEASHFVEECGVLSTEISLAGSDPFGRVTSGFIELRGHLVPTKIRFAYDFLDYAGNLVRRYHIHLNGIDHSFDPDLELGELAIPSQDTDLMFVCRLPSKLSVAPISSEISLSLLYLGHEMYPVGGEIGRGRQLFLVLGISPTNFDRYERLGCLAISYEEWDEWPEPFTEAQLATVVIV